MTKRAFWPLFAGKKSSVQLPKIESNVYFRHDAPLRFMNLHTGERLAWVVKFIDMFIQEFKNEKISDRIGLTLMYDIACQLDSFLHNKNNHFEEVAKRIEVVVNKFHGYAHEYRCHERWGAHQKQGLGESDGEGVNLVLSARAGYFWVSRQSYF